jgi:mannose-6-phosphate isomerase-like protein (cupin superfamily)
LPRPSPEKVDLAEALASFDEAFEPRVVGRYNDSKIMVAKTRGEFVWHSHPDTDDFFLVLDGKLTIQLRDRDVELGPGELFVVPRGVEHCPVSARKRNPLARIPLARRLLGAEPEAHILLIEPVGTPNTGDSTEREAAPEREL